MAKTAIVTGANRGMGKAIAIALANKGMEVIIACRDLKSGENVAEAIRKEKRKATAYEMDQADLRSIERFHAAVVAEHPDIDILINSAAINPDEPTFTIQNIPEDILRKTMETNVFGVLWLCRLFASRIAKSSSGRIINFSSGLGMLSVPRMGPFPSYSLSKTSVNAITTILAEELKDTPARVVSVDPGWVRTDMGGPEAPLLIDEGIDTPIWLATARPPEITSGRFYKERRPLEW